MSESMQPERYKTRILLMATGMTPQVVTETVYALAVQRSPAFVPTEIHLVSTAGGIAHARNMLLAEGKNMLGALVKDYNLPRIKCDESCLHVIRNAEKRPLTDIQTPEDNVAAANAIVQLVRDLTTAHPDSAIHASIAGGRKTMGFYVGYAMSLFGRLQDRMSHVLVNAPFESNAEFFYPPKSPRVIVLSGNTSANTKDASVMLADIPFVRLRHGFTLDELKRGVTSYEAAVSAAQAAFAPPSIVIDRRTGTLHCGGRRVDLQPLLFAFYLWFCEMRRAGTPVVVKREVADAAGLLKWLRRVKDDQLDSRFEKTKRVFEEAGGVSADYLREKIARIKESLVKALGSQAAAEPYLIVRQGPRTASQYALTIAAESIAGLES